MTTKKINLNEFKERARQFRKEILETITEAGSGHPGGSLSGVEIMISLYYYKMRHKPENPGWPLRDRFIMSKGHARVPGVELSTGSLGQGFSVGNGIALGARIRGVNFRVYTLLGDGEIQEGQVWEAAMTAGHHKLDNVCAILDRNGVQENGPVEEIKREEPLADKWRSFGWHVLDVNGHDFEQLIDALDQAETVKGKPAFIIARTIKGKGVSFMEGQAKWHGKAPDKEQLRAALSELGF